MSRPRARGHDDHGPHERDSAGGRPKERPDGRSGGRLAEALALARLGTFEWDLASDVVAFDACAIWGFGADEAVTSPAVFARIDEGDRARVQAEVAASHQKLSQFPTDFRINRPDGTIVTVASLNTVRAGANGRAAQVTGVFQDVTAERAAAAALRVSEARYRQLVEEAEDFAIVALDEHGVITDWNSGAERVLGWTRDEAVGQPGSLFFTPEDAAEGVPDREMNRAAVNGRAVDERWHLRCDGSRFWGSGLMMRLDGGGYLKMFRDRTAKHEAEVSVRARRGSGRSCGRPPRCSTR